VNSEDDDEDEHEGDKVESKSARKAKSAPKPFEKKLILAGLLNILDGARSKEG